jgi:hypothetical protein
MGKMPLIFSSNGPSLKSSALSFAIISFRLAGEISKPVGSSHGHQETKFQKLPISPSAPLRIFLLPALMPFIKKRM